MILIIGLQKNYFMLLPVIAGISVFILCFRRYL